MRQLYPRLLGPFVTLTLLLTTAPFAVKAQVISPTPPARHYVLHDLTPIGATTSTAAGASVGQQVGSASFPASVATTSPVSRAMLWSGGAPGVVDLGPGAAVATDGGQQVGSSGNRAALWTGTALSKVDLSPAGWTQSVAAGVRNGQQVGSATRQVVCVEKKGRCPNGTRQEIHPFLWTGSSASAVDLTPLGLGYGAGRALGTDGAQQVGFGQFVLGINAFSGPFAVLWSGTAESAVNLNPPNSLESQANGVAGGQQVGFGFYPRRALLWRGSAESVIDLHPDGYAFSEANATNGVQQVGFGFVGDAETLAGHYHALVWTGAAGSVIDLNQFLPPQFTDAAATGIDAAGNVVGWASRGPRSNPANVRAVMWRPREPGAVYLQSLALSQDAVVAGSDLQATVTLSAPAPAGGAVVVLGHSLNSNTAAPFTVELPAEMSLAEGQTSASFRVGTVLRTLDGFSQPSPVVIQAAFGGVTQTASLAVAPPPYLSSLTVSPNSVTGGVATTGTVTLNGVAPAGGALVTLASSSPAANVPGSVFVPEELGNATFNITTNVVTTPIQVTLNAIYGGLVNSSRTATLTVMPAPSRTDTVVIQQAEYNPSKRQLTVQATSTSSAATLTVSVTSNGSVIGVLSNRGGGRYAATFNVATNPQEITVNSSLNGRATRRVSLK